MKKLSVLGAGGWGIAISNLLAGGDNQVTLWKHDPAATKVFASVRQDHTKLPGITLRPEIDLTSELREAVSDTEIILVAIPAQNSRALFQQLKAIKTNARVIVSLTKGIEVLSQKRISELLSEILSSQFQDRIVVVSGPSHAEEVALGIPTSVVAAGQSPEAVAEIQQLLSTPRFRVYSSDDLIGVELGGALKNVIALAAGMVYGLRLGDNTMGALLTRGLAEITRLGLRMGAKAETFAGLSGLGDLVTTCGSHLSRNRQVGERIGRGEKLSHITASMTMIAEGVQTARAAVRLAEKYRVEMPITQQVYQVLFDSKPPLEAVNDLMTRELKREVYS